jgi:SprB repeat/Secretion system C-terminal sorting domain
MKKSIFGLVVSCLLIISFNGFGQNRSCSNSSQPTSCPGFRTYTQGAWGANPCGNNAATFLQSNFAAVFPTGVTLGCTNKLRFTSANAIRNFLPSGGTPSALPNGTLLNPNNYNNVLAGQLLALTLNVKFDDYFANFAPASGKLKDLIIASGPFVGMTVQQLVDNANQKIGGCTAFNKTFSEYNAAITSVNQTYDNGYVSGGFLSCPSSSVTPLSATLTSTGVSCFGGSNGTITVSASGGTQPYSYVFGNSAATTSSSKTGLSAGTYSVVVTDAANQVFNLTAVINQNPVLAAQSTYTDNSCNSANGSSNGSAQVTISGGVAPYSVQWSNGATGTSLSGLASGSYTYNVMDAAGCSASGQVSITEPTAISATISTSEIIRCSNECTGELITNVTGGTGNYTYLWSDGQTSSHAINLCAGIYDLTITDENECVLTLQSDLLENPNPIIVNPVVNNPNLCFYDCNAQITLDVTGGEAPYMVQWDNQGEGTIQNNLCVGSYSADITDSRGCVFHVSPIDVVNPPMIEISLLDIGSVSGCNTTVCDASATVELTGGFPPYQIQWNVDNQQSNTITGLCMFTELAIDVVDQMNCIAHFDLGIVDCNPLPGEANPFLHRNAILQVEPTMEFYPNPVHGGNATLTYQTDHSETIWVNVYSSTGQLISSNQQIATDGMNAFNLDFSHVASQTCLVTLIHGNEIMKKLIIVE